MCLSHAAAAHMARQPLPGQPRAFLRKVPYLRCHNTSSTRVWDMACVGWACRHSLARMVSWSPVTCRSPLRAPLPVQCRKRDYGGQYSLAMRGLQAHKNSATFRWWAITALTLQALHGPEGIPCHRPGMARGCAWKCGRWPASPCRVQPGLCCECNPTRPQDWTGMTTWLLCCLTCVKVWAGTPGQPPRLAGKKCPAQQPATAAPCGKCLPRHIRAAAVVLCSGRETSLYHGGFWSA